jgi:hypothetical protein
MKLNVLKSQAAAAKKADAAPLKKYTFEAPRVQWEKPTEPKYIFCRTATVTVLAASEAEATALAGEKLKKEYAGTGMLLGEAKLLSVVDLPVDWSYGYGDERKSGATASLGDLVGNNTIR